MSAFDDEFGLFGEGSEEVERRPTLGARKIASGETVIDDVEPEDEQPRRAPRVERPPRREREYGHKRRSETASSDPWAGHRRASDLLGFLAKRLVAKPDDVEVELFMDEDGKPVIELVVDPEDLGKVIGRSGRVAHALRTVVRATAEGRVSVDILDTEEAAQAAGESGEDDA
ncbi:MAG: KH domain-containing protein [Candidatus Eremiobacteraeota bacterium]|nr:KH domain-containing protein [Candidatus Eremiobacteraeota bacterium]